MEINSKWGGWNKEEYLENYQIISYKENSFIDAEFYYPYQNLTSGAYIKIATYNANGDFLNLAILHWGKDEDLVKYMTQSWGYMFFGQRTAKQIINILIVQNKARSFKLPVQNNVQQNLKVSIDSILSDLEGFEDVDHYSLSFGIWTKYNEVGTPYKSKIRVKKMGIEKNGYVSNHPILFNNVYIPMVLNENPMDYGK